MPPTDPQILPLDPAATPRPASPLRGLRALAVRFVVCFGPHLGFDLMAEFVEDCRAALRAAAIDTGRFRARLDHARADLRAAQGRASPGGPRITPAEARAIDRDLLTVSALVATHQSTLTHLAAD